MNAKTKVPFFWSMSKPPWNICSDHLCVFLCPQLSQCSPLPYFPLFISKFPYFNESFWKFVPHPSFWPVTISPNVMLPIQCAVVSSIIVVKYLYIMPYLVCRIYIRICHPFLDIWSAGWSASLVLYLPNQSSAVVL